MLTSNSLRCGRTVWELGLGGSVAEEIGAFVCEGEAVRERVLDDVDVGGKLEVCGFTQRRDRDPVSLHWRGLDSIRHLRVRAPPERHNSKGPTPQILDVHVAAKFPLQLRPTPLGHGLHLVGLHLVLGCICIW